MLPCSDNQCLQERANCCVGLAFKTVDQKLILIRTMNMTKRSIIFFFLLSMMLICEGFSQTDNQFWFSVPHIPTNSTDGEYLFRIVNHDLPNTVTLSLPASSDPQQPGFFEPLTMTLDPFETAVFDVSAVINDLWNEEPYPGQIYGRGVKIESDHLIHAAFEVSVDGRAEVFSLKGQNGLGSLFNVPFQKEFNNPSAADHAGSSINIVATEDNTLLRITPGADMFEGFQENVPFEVTLEKGQTISLVPDNFQTDGQLAANRLAGTKIESNHPVAVTVSDQLWLDEADPDCTDLAGDQLISSNLAGNQYVVVNDGGNDYYYVLPTTDGTQITIDGNIMGVFDAGEQFSWMPAGGDHHSIETSEDIYLMQMLQDGCAAGMAVVPPVDQCTGSFEQIFVHHGNDDLYVNLMVREGAEDAFRVNGGVPNTTIPAADFTFTNADAPWMVAQVKLVNENVPQPQVFRIRNTEDVFHAGLINSKQVQPTTKGYAFFSGFDVNQVSAGINTPDGQNQISVCFGETVQLAASAGTSHQWAPAGFLDDPDAQFPVSSPESDVTYQVVINGACNQTASSSVAIEVAEPLLPLFSVEETVGCAPFEVQIENLSAGVTDFLWDFGDGNTSITHEPQFSHTYTNNTEEPIEYELKLLVDNGLCTDSLSTTITVLPQVQTDIVTDHETLAGCAPFSVSFSHDSENAGTISWDFGDGNTSPQENTEHVFQNFTDETVTYQTTVIASSVYPDLGSCQVSSTVDIEVFPLIDADFELNTYEGCHPLHLDVENTSQGSGGFTWHFDDGTMPFVENEAFFSYLLHNNTADEQDYQVQLTAENSFGCKDSLEMTVTVFPEPSADFLPADTLLCNPATVSFQNLSSGGVSWQWDFGEAGTSLLENPDPVLFAHENEQERVLFPVFLTVVSQNGCQAMDSGNVEVAPLLEAGFALNRQEICPSGGYEMVQIIDESKGSSATHYKILWDGEEQVIDSGEEIVEFEAGNSTSQPLVYTVWQFVSNEHNCQDSLMKEVVVYPEVKALVQQVADGCHPLEATFQNLSENAGTYHWSFSNGMVSTVENPTLTFQNSSRTEPLEIEAVLTAGSSYGCTDDTTFTFTVFPLPLAGFQIPESQICAPGMVVFNDESILSGNEDYFWDFGDGTDSIAAPGNLEHYFQNNTTETLFFSPQLTVTNEFGCSDSVSREILLYPEVTAAFHVSATEGCSPLEVSFINESTGAGGVLPYQWDYGNGHSTAQSPEHARTFVNNDFDDPEVFNVQLVATSEFGCTDTLQEQFHVFPVPFADFAMSGSEGCSPFEVSFTDLSEGSDLTYAWEFEPGEVYDQDTGALHTYEVDHSSDAEDFLPTLTLINAYGCSDTAGQTITVFPDIVAGFSSDTQQGCHPFSPEIINESLGADQFFWDFGDGDSSQDVEPAPVFSNNSLENPANYQTWLKVSSSYGCVDSVHMDFTVFPTPVADFQMSQHSGCSPLDIQVTNIAQGAGNETYLWTANGDTVNSSNAGSFVHGFSNTTSDVLIFPVGQVLTNSFGCSGSLQKDVEVYPEVSAEFTTPDAWDGCSPHAIQFENQSQLSTRYNWIFGDGGSSSMPEPEHVFISANDSVSRYEVLLQATSDYGCTDLFSREVIVYAQPYADFSVDPYQQFIPGRTIQVSNTSSSGNWNFSWDMGDGYSFQTKDRSPFDHEYDIDVSENVTHEFHVVLNASSDHCSSTSEQKVVLKAREVSVGFSPAAKGCPPLEVAFFNDSMYGEAFFWDFDDGRTSEEENPVHVFEEPGFYEVTLVVSGEVNTDSTSVVITVHQPPVAAFAVEPQIITLPDDEAQMINLSSMAFTSFWDFGDGTTSEEYQPVHQYEQAGEYTVELTVGNDTDPVCYHRFSREVKVVNTPENICNMVFPNAFTPDPSGPSGGSYSLNDPANYVFHPLHQRIEDYHLEVFNMWGEKIFESRDIMIGWDGYLDGQPAPMGVYIFQSAGTCDDGRTIEVKGDVTLVR